MELEEYLEKVNSKEEFVEFVYQLVEDLKRNSQNWANVTLETYLNGIASWINDRDGLYADSEEDYSEDIDWGSLAFMLYAGGRYE